MYNKIRERVNNQKRILEESIQLATKVSDKENTQIERVDCIREQLLDIIQFDVEHIKVTNTIITRTDELQNEVRLLNIRTAQDAIRIKNLTLSLESLRHFVGYPEE
jgi:hypothetical protein